MQAKRSRLPLFRAGFIAFILLIALNLGFFLIADFNTRLIYSDIISPLTNFLAVVCLYFAARSTEPFFPRMAKGWKILSIAQLVYTLGDIAWAILELVLRIQPYPSLADAFYIAFYPLFIIATFYFISPRQTGVDWAKKILDLVIVLTATFLALWNFVVQPLALADINLPAMTRTLSLCYPLCDLIIFCGAFWMIDDTVNRKVRLPILLIAASAITTVFVDIYFSYSQLNSTYHTGGWIDIGYSLSYLFMALAALLQIRLMKQNEGESLQQLTRPDDSKLILKIMSFYPYLWLFFIYFLLLPPNQSQFKWANPLNYIGVGILIGLAFVRALVSILENDLLISRLQKTLIHMQDQAEALERTNMDLLHEIAVRKKAENQLTYDSTHDALTDLPNRVLFDEELKRAINISKFSRKKVYSLFLLDIDQFKIINDSMGHQAGDELLEIISNRLRACTKGNDIIARVGGDEFAILHESSIRKDNLPSLARRVQEEIKKEIILRKHTLIVTTSIGAVLDIGKYESQGDAFRDADIALYHAKSRGKNHIEVFKTQMRSEAYSRLEIEEDLRGALAKKEFELYYQPIVRLSDFKLFGFEALIRWNHPHYGLLTPTDFINIAEETDLIVPIGQWVLVEACRQLKEWLKRYPEYQPLRVHVNISARQLIRSNFVTVVETALEQTGLPSQLLRLEITESISIGNYQKFLEKFHRLNDLGVHLEIDDFGTGFSSLSYIQNFPFHVLKIAMPFVQEIGTRKKSADLINTINTMANALGLETIAEGIETEIQLSKLKEIGCQFGQGALFSSAISTSLVEKILSGDLSFTAGLNSEVENHQFSRTH